MIVDALNFAVVGDRNCGAFRVRPAYATKDDSPFPNIKCSSTPFRSYMACGHIRARLGGCANGCKQGKMGLIQGDKISRFDRVFLILWKYCAR